MDLKEKVASFPKRPGVYLIRDGEGEVLYVGKAKSLRTRVRSYLRDGGDGRPHIRLLMARARDVDYIITTTEKEALILENSLIKKHHPRYNVELRDDKTYLSLRLSAKEKFPKLTLVRRIKNDGAEYFGPYSSAGKLRETVDLLHKLFPLRQCSDREFTSRTRPCLYHTTRGCPAPCMELIDQAGYGALVDEIRLFLRGRKQKLIERLKSEMKRAAEDERFEEAATLRDRLLAVETTLLKQKAVTHKPVDRDAIGVVREGAEAQFVVLVIRSGVLIDSRAYYFKNLDEDDGEIVSEFIRRYYRENRIVPGEIVIGSDPGEEEREVLEQWLAEKREKKVNIILPKRGERLELLQMACENGEKLLAERRRSKVGYETALEELRQRLSLPAPPRRMECYDISNIQGKNPVGSMVTFLDGFPDKEHYRRFKIKTVEGADDFAMMREVLLRRFARDSGGWEYPDLVVIDGGKGQLAAALAAMEERGAGQVPVIGLAKSRPIPGSEGLKSPERIFLPGRMNPLTPSKNSSAIFLLQRIRDEAHRFAIEFYRKSHRKEAVSSALEKIPGVGPQKRKALIARFGSLKKVKGATHEELSNAEGIGPTLALEILKHLNNVG